MKAHHRDEAILFRPSLRDRVDWMTHWVISRGALRRRRNADPLLAPTEKEFTHATKSVPEGIVVANDAASPGLVSRN